MPDSDEQLAIMRLAWRLDALDRWRKEAMQEIGALRRDVDGVTRAQEIADGVAAKLQETGVTVQAGGLGLTWWQKLGGAVGGALLIADAAKGLIT